MKTIMLRTGLSLGLGVLLILSLIISHPSQFSEQAVAQTTTIEVPFHNEWAASPHADVEAEAFSHWNEDEPREIPVECAKCHSTSGYRDFIGADGSEAGVVNRPVAVGTSVECVACHNQSTFDLDRVVMPSGLEITGLGDEARCMQCHQGRTSKFSVDEAIAEMNPADADTVSPDMEFVNIHYNAAVVTKYGTMAKGGYEYDGKAYDAHFTHITDFDPCISCHYAHSQEIKFDNCQTCHEEATSLEDLKDIRMHGSLVDYDGDDNIEEGIHYEIEGLRHTLYQGIQKYAGEVSNTPIVYSLQRHPYFFVDSNNNGQADQDEIKFPNKYDAWTARLLKAAYNYQVSSKDPGGFAHGGKYIIQLLYDSIEDLNTVLSIPVDLKQMRRIDDGHFAGSEEAFRHWDVEGTVPAACSKCHTGVGLPLFLQEGVTMTQAPSNGLKCTTCHDDLDDFSRYEVAHVTFPSGVVIDSGDPHTNLCMNCHQGRESTVSVNKLTKGIQEDEISDALRFLNIHYFAAGATRFGTEAKGGYEYAGKEYVGVFNECDIFKQPDEEGNVPSPGCLSCHTAHGLEVEKTICVKCHQEVQDERGLRAIRKSPSDYDGDGNAQEGIAEEIDTLLDALYSAVQEYASHVINTAIVYDPHNYPYFFNDSNGNGQADANETIRDNRYTTWTPRLLRAAYNYQYAKKDPGAFAHNGKYILQLLYDSLENLGSEDMISMSRP